MSTLEDNVRDVETERDELKSRIQSMTAMAEEKDKVNQLKNKLILRFLTKWFAFFVPPFFLLMII